LTQYEIIFEDDDILVVDKLAPLPVQKDKSNDLDLQTLLGGDNEHPRPFLEAAHRIDRRTSGILVFARNAHALRTLEAAFRNRQVRKTYMACLEKEPIPPEGTLRHRIVTDPVRNISRALPLGSPAQGGNAVPAELSYRLILPTERYFFVEASPLTGRHHQIRAQFAAVGWPIRGDLKYGARRSSPSGRIMLHGYRIEFDHPRSGERLAFTAPLPRDETLWTLLADFLGGRGEP
jgi:23S rRNA pseudouridine1911/1915/1917 synthase